MAGSFTKANPIPVKKKKKKSIWNTSHHLGKEKNAFILLKLKIFKVSFQNRSCYSEFHGSLSLTIIEQTDRQADTQICCQNHIRMQEYIHSVVLKADQGSVSEFARTQRKVREKCSIQKGERK